MSMKPTVINAAQVSEQTHKISKELKEMDMQLKLLERRLAATERSLAENETLRNTVARLRGEVFGQFLSEWEKRKTHYPEIRLGVLTKTAELLTPPKKDKGAPGSDPKPR